MWYNVCIRLSEPAGTLENRYTAIIAESASQRNWGKQPFDRWGAEGMGLGRTDRRLLALILAAGAVMLLRFALSCGVRAPLDPLPRTVPAAAVPADRTELVDVNAAGLEELMSLPGIGEVRARAILDDRAENGPYRYPEDLIRVRGIGEGILEDILDQITTGGDDYAQNIGG